MTREYVLNALRRLDPSGWSTSYIYLSNLPELFRHDLFSNKLSFSNENPIYFNYRARHLKEINILD